MNVKGKDWMVEYFPGWLDGDTVDWYWKKFEESDELNPAIEWNREFYHSYGKSIPVPRQTAWYGDPGAKYKYYGIVNHPLPLSENKILEEIRQKLQGFIGATFNSVLCNRYVDGNSSVGWHSDDEPELGETPTIASVTIGYRRLFKMRLKKDIYGATMEFPLEWGDLLVMHGKTQQVWEHSIPKAAKVDGPRINLTYRYIKR